VRCVLCWGFIKGWALSKLTGCEDDFVQFKKFCPCVKTSCPSAETVIGE